MFVNHQTYNIPSKVGPIKIKPLFWSDFKGTRPQNSPFLAHIYWTVNYQFGNVSQGQPKVKVTVSVRPKSWKITQTKGLLTHQYGHYLIGCLCALSFAQKVNFEWNRDPKLNFGDWCRYTLNQCLKFYCSLETQYDDQTDHNLDDRKQRQWQEKIRDYFYEFHNYFESKKKKALKKDDRSSANLTEQNPNRPLNTLNQSKGIGNRNVTRNFSIKKQTKDFQKKIFGAERNSISKQFIKRDNCNNISERKGSIITQLKSYKMLQQEIEDNGSKSQLANIKSTIPRPFTTQLKPL